MTLRRRSNASKARKGGRYRTALCCCTTPAVPGTVSPAATSLTLTGTSLSSSSVPASRHAADPGGIPLLSRSRYYYILFPPHAPGRVHGRACFWSRRAHYEPGGPREEEAHQEPAPLRHAVAPHLRHRG